MPRPAFRPGPRRAPVLRRVAPRPRARRVYALVAALVLALGTGVAMAMASPMQEQQEPAPEPTPVASPTPGPDEAPDRPIAWRRSRALGLPYAGRLRDGVKLPPDGRDFYTWDPVLRQSPNRGWRRWGTDHLLRTLLLVLREHRAAFPEAPRIGIGDISRPHGGEFGRRFGALGHMSHQNGLDVDVYYPRWDGLEKRAHTPDLVDEELAQDLVDRFVGAGAQKVFVGPSLHLTGPRRVVIKLIHHDDHLHVRLRKPAD